MSSNHQFTKTVLPNGLTVLGEYRASAKSVALGYFVRTGARDEEPELAGVSHFLEHMMFKGTAKRSALDITYELGALGAQANAYTSEENTVYYMAVLPEFFSQALELLCDMLRPALDETEFNVEKKVILEEIALYQDRPTHVLFERALREHFGKHPAGNSVLGTTDSVSALSASQMRGYFDRRYTAANMVLVASGCFDWNKLVEEASSYTANWPALQVSRAIDKPSPTPVSLTLTKPDLQMGHLMLIASGPSAQEESRYAAHCLTSILGDSSGSRVFWELVDKGLVDSANIDNDEMDGAGMVYGYASAEPERLDEVAGVLRRILTTPGEFSDDQLERAKTKVGTRLVLQGESTMRRLMAVGNEWTYRKRYRALAEELAEFKKVDRKAIDSLLENYSFTPLTEVRLLPA